MVHYREHPPGSSLELTKKQSSTVFCTIKTCECNFFKKLSIVISFINEANNWCLSDLTTIRSATMTPFSRLSAIVTKIVKFPSSNEMLAIHVMKLKVSNEITIY